MYYRAQWAYEGGPGVRFAAGDVVELTDAWAAAINADSPGVLLPAPETPARAIDAAPSDRMVKASGRTRGRPRAAVEAGV